jgi:hypothetical protein
MPGCRAWLLPRVAILGTKSGCLTTLDCSEPGGSVLMMLAGTGDPEMQATSLSKEEQLRAPRQGKCLKGPPVMSTMFSLG